jgi:hypothetical protein
VNDNLPSPSDPAQPIRDQLDDLAVLLALWGRRDESPVAARQAASLAIDLCNGMQTAVGALRDRLVDDALAYDETTAIATDALLERLRREHGITPLPDSTDSDDIGHLPTERPWISGNSGPGWSPDDELT